MSKNDDRAKEGTKPLEEQPRIFAQANLGRGPQKSRRDFLKAAGAVGAVAGLAACASPYDDDGMTSDRRSQCEIRFRASYELFTCALAFKSNAELLSCGDHGHFKAWDLGTGACASMLNIDDDDIRCAAFSPDLSVAFVGSTDCMYFVDLATWAYEKIDVEEVLGTADYVGYIWVRKIAISSGNQDVFISFEESGSSIYLGKYHYDRDTKKLTLVWTQRLSVPGYNFILSKDESRLYVPAKRDNSFQVLKASDGSLQANLDMMGEYGIVAEAPSGELVWASTEIGTSGPYGKVIVLDPDTLETRRSWSCGNTPQALAFSADGAGLFICHVGHLSVWSLASGSELTLPGNELQDVSLIAAKADLIVVANGNDLEVLKAGDYSLAVQKTLIDPDCVVTWSVICGSSGHIRCICDTVCTCDAVCSCESVCSCNSHSTSHSYSYSYTYWY